MYAKLCMSLTSDRSQMKTFSWKMVNYCLHSDQSVKNALNLVSILWWSDKFSIHNENDECSPECKPVAQMFGYIRMSQSELFHTLGQ